MSNPHPPCGRVFGPFVGGSALLYRLSEGLLVFIVIIIYSGIGWWAWCARAPEVRKPRATDGSVIPLSGNYARELSCLVQTQTRSPPLIDNVCV